jgi:hypothetical protein
MPLNSLQKVFRDLSTARHQTEAYFWKPRPYLGCAERDLYDGDGAPMKAMTDQAIKQLILEELRELRSSFNEHASDTSSCEGVWWDRKVKFPYR